MWILLFASKVRWLSPGHFDAVGLWGSIFLYFHQLSRSSLFWHKREASITFLPVGDSREMQI